MIKRTIRKSKSGDVHILYLIKQYNELQDSIDAIVTTARLLGYEIKQTSNLTKIYKPSQMVQKPIISIMLHQLSDYSIELSTKTLLMKSKDFVNNFYRDTHERKLAHLEKILQSL